MNLRTPGKRLAVVFVLGVLLVVSTIQVALLSPYLGFQLQEKDLIKVGAEQLVLESEDLREEPGEIEDQAVLNRFYQRQDSLAELLEAPSVQIERAEQVLELQPRDRKIGDLSPLFWTQVVVALGALVIGGWIWAIRSRDLASIFFAVSGLSVCLSALPSAIYTTREGGIPSGIFLILEELNAISASAFGISMIALFLVYPMRLPFWKRGVVLQALFLGTWTLLSVMKVFWDVTHISLIMLTEMILICVLIGVQFFATRRDPRARAALIWLGLSVLLGAGAFIGFNTVPSLLGMPSLSQGYAFLFFLIIYLGLAAGLTQYRLFEVGQWAFRLLFYAIGALLLALLDAALVFGLGMDRFPALGLALLLVGFLYLPVREYIWSFFSKRGRLETHESIEQALHVAFAPSENLRTDRWVALIRRIFDPLEVEPCGNEYNQVELSDDGLTLTLPPVAGTPSLKLSYPWSGRSLFTKESKALANQMVSLIAQAESSRKAYDRGVLEERRRMAQDLHDDVGARLLTGIGSVDEKFKPILQGALSEIRSIVSGMTGERIPMDSLIADLRHEASQRLSLVKIELDWPLLQQEMGQYVLEYRQQKALSSAIREAVSNVIRHSGASSLSIRINEEKGSLRVMLSDDGKGFVVPTPGDKSRGFGLYSLNRRLQDAGGSIRIESSERGTVIQFVLPYKIN